MDNTVESVEPARDEAEMHSLAVSACAIELGVGIIKEMVGDTISKGSDADLSELVSANIKLNLKL